MQLNPPDIKELRAIVDWVNLAEDVREVSLKFGDVELFISRDRQRPGTAPATPVAAAPVAAAPVAAPAPVAAAPAPSASEPSPADTLAPDEVLIKAPMVGIFYASPKPGAPHFVSVGDSVTADSVLCIVEVMKLMSNVEAQVEGTVARILVDNEQAVEFGQPLMVIKRRA
ncbi:acetyl-CoA carboxylase biotin carboxyl carrier protein [Arthrobacter sp. KK5.5]|uniref:acetyl-CoA carboxylase biotin carboxyl carrier protein n=1 Tax=Arthrobacter sp. KK5.5 TaxID=3373084 RepID=UPI003EE56CCF